MSTGERSRARAFGLRTRLMLAFLLVAAVSAGTTAALTYREARNAILRTTQDTAETEIMFSSTKRRSTASVAER